MARMSLDTAIRLSAEVKGGGNVDRVKRSLQELAQSSQVSARDMATLRSATFQFARANDNTVAGIRNSIAAFRGLQEQAQIGSREFRRYSTEIQQLEQRLRGLDGPARQAGESLGRQLAGGLAAGLATIGTGQIAIGSLNAVVASEESERRLRSLSQGLDDYSKVQATATAAAQRFGTAQTQTNEEFAQIYARLRPIGLTLQEISTVYNGFNTAAKLSGANSAEASAAFLQLSQALGTGVLRGEELNSVFEQTPAVVQAIAQVMGVPIGRIRELAEQGKITGNIVLQALGQIERDGAPKLAEAMKGPAQQFRNLQIAGNELQIELGEALLPTAIALANGITYLIKSFNALPDPIKTATFVIVGLTSAIVALGSSLLIVGGIQQYASAIGIATAATGAATIATKALSLAIVAMPWVALAAGITAATVALANWQTQSEKTGAAARSGAPAEMAAARTRLANTGQEISLLERQRETARGPERGSIDRRLNKLQAEQRQLRADIQAGERATPPAAAQLPPTAAAAAAAAAPPSTGSGSGGSDKKKELSIAAQTAKALQSALNLTEAQAAGAVGALMRESGRNLNPRLNEGGQVGSPRGVGGYGQAQWTGTRQQNLIGFAGGAANAGDRLTQLRFMVSELLGPESKALAELRKATTPEEAAVAFDRSYLRSGIKALPERKANARQVFKELSGDGGQASELGGFSESLRQTNQQRQAAEDLLKTERNRLRVLEASDPLQRQVTEAIVKQSEIQDEYARKLAESKSPMETRALELARENALRVSSIELERSLTEATKAATDPLNEAIKSAADKLAFEREYGELIAQGVNPELARQFVELDRIAAKSKENLQLQIQMLEAKAAELPVTSEIRKELERQIELRRQQLKMIPGATDQAKKDIVQTGKAQADPRRKIGERVGQLRDELKQLVSLDRLVITSADNIGNAFGSAFRDLITGAASAREALAGFFKNVAASFAEMAAEIIAKQMTMIILQTILKALGAVAGAASGGTSNLGVDAQKIQFNPAAFSMPRLAANGAYFNEGVAAFANGGAFSNSIVSSPTMFRFADGGAMRTGLMGEAGPEAIMPLRRGPDGRLGVDASGLAVPFQRPTGAAAAGAELEVPFQRIAAGLEVPFLKDGAAAAGSTAAGAATIDVRFETVRIGDLDVVTREEAQRIGRESAQRGAELAHKRYRNNPSARRAAGLA